MSKVFEDLVPPLELCKQIPKGKFEDSALWWIEEHIPGNETPIDSHVCERRTCEYHHGGSFVFHPAPTLQEIMIDTYRYGFVYPQIERTCDSFVARIIGGGKYKIYRITTDDNPATALLELWLTFIGEKNANID